MLAKWDQFCPGGHPNWKLRRRIRKGIPSPEIRAVAWPRIIRSADAARANPAGYAALVASPIPADVADSIERDLPRTFPSLPAFAPGASGFLRLRRVLRALAAYSPEVGYCQGMGFVAGVAVSALPEDDAFWFLATMMASAEHSLSQLWRRGFPLLQQLFVQLSAALAEAAPRVARNFATIGVTPELYASQWFLTLFSYSMPLPTVLRVWDCFILDGWRFAVRLAVALLRADRDRLTSAKLEDVLPLLRDLGTTIPPDILVKQARAIPLTAAQFERSGRSSTVPLPGGHDDSDGPDSD